MKLKLPRLRWLIALFLLPAVLAGTVIGVGAVWINSPSGLDWLRRTLVERASVPGEFEIGLEGLEGSLWSDLRITGLTLADSEGTWLTLDEARLAWTPAALLQRRLQIDALESGRLSVVRAPLSRSAEAEEEPASFEVPEIPLAIRVERLALEEIALGEALAGTPARLTLNGKLAADESGQLEGELRLEQIDGALRLSLDGGYGLEDGILEAKLSAQDSAGGLIARFAGDPSLPALSLSLEGKAPLTDWRGKIAAEAEGMASLAGEIALPLEPHPGLAYQGSLSLPMLADSQAAPFLGESSQVDLSVSLMDGQALAVERLNLESDSLSLRLAGDVDLDRLTGELTAEASLKDPAALSGLAPGVALSGLTLSVRQSGALTHPALEGSARIEGLSVDRGPRFDGLDLVFAADPQAERPLGWTLSLDAESQGFSLDAEEAVATLAQRLAGTAPGLAFRGGLDLDAGDLAVDSLTLEGQEMTAGAAGRLSLNGQGPADLTFDLELATLEPLSGFAGRPLSGAARLEGEASLDLTVPSATGRATLTTEQLDLAEPLARSLLGDPRLETAFSYGSAGLSLSDLSVTGDGVTLSANLSLDAAFEALSGDYDLVLSDLTRLEPVLAQPPAGEARLTGTLSGRLSAPASRFTLALPGASIDGDLSLPEGATLPLGRVSLALSNPAPWAALAGLPGLEAKGGLDIDLSAPEGRARAGLSGDFTNVSLPDGTKVGRARLGGSVSDLLGQPVLDLSLGLSGAAAGPVKLTRLDATAKGGLAALDLTLEGGGDLVMQARARPLKLSLSARAEGLDAAVQNFTVRQGGRITLDAHELRLSQAVNAKLEGGTLSLAAPGLALDDGGLALSATRSAEGASLDLTLTSLPMALAGLVLADAPEGRLSGKVALSGGRAANGDIDLSVTGLRLAEGQDLPPLNADITGRLDGKTLRASLTATGPVEQPLRAEVSLPGRLDLITPALHVRDDAPLDGSITWNGQAAQLAALFAPANIRASGDLALDARLSGTPAKPDLRGEAALTRGRFEHLEQGTYFEDLTLRLAFDGEQVTVAELSGDDSLGGSIQGQGSIAVVPERGFPLDLSIKLANLRVVTRDEAKANVSGDLSAKGSLNGMEIVGRFKTERVEISLANDLPPEVVDLNPTPVGALSERSEEEPAPGALDKIALDITVEVPNQLFVRGRGLDSEWQGGVQVAGTAARPAITGQLNVVRGEVSLIGKRFTLTEGVIRLPSRPGSPPVLDVLAVHQAETVEARVKITGPSDNIKIELSSVPELPQDEILARVLFNKSGGELSALEAVQIASAVAQLTGRSGGVGILDRVRNTLGVDVLRVEGGQGDAGPTVEAGRYLTDDVYVGVEQGADPRSGAVSVELGVTDNISVESKLKESGSSNIGINFEWDY